MDGTNRIDELEQKFIENPRRYFAPLANEYRKAGNPHQAIAICRAHLAQLPSHMSGQIVYGQALFEGGEYDQAQTVFENALAMDRENLVALRHLGDLALRKGETAAARQWFAKFLEIDPKDANVISLVDEIDAAAEAISSTTDADPASATTPEAVQPMPEPQAEPDHTRSEEEDTLIAEELGYPAPPAHAFMTETMAELYLAQGFRERAVSVYRQLVENRPEDERLRNRLAELEEPAGEAEPATLSEAEPEPSEPEPSEPSEPELSEPEPSEPEPSAPRALTVREFFANLGKVKPAARSNGSSTNGTGHTDADLDPPADSSSTSDAKAAAALAGAFGGAPASPTFADASANPVPGKESEEDVARFRAWLDGLTT